MPARTSRPDSWRKPPLGTPINQSDPLVQCATPPGACAFADYVLAEGNGLVAIDSCQPGSIYTQGTLNSNSWGKGRGGPAYVANGSTTRIDIGVQSGAGTNPLRLAAGPMTIFAIINPSSVAAGVTVIAGCSNSAGTAESWWIGINRTSGKLEMGWHGAVIVAGNKALTVNTWYSVVFVRSGTAGAYTAKIYIDGIQDATASTATNPDSSTAMYASIGRFGADNQFYFNGLIERFGITARAWQPGEVEEHFHEPYRHYYTKLRRSRAAVAVAFDASLISAIYTTESSCEGVAGNIALNNYSVAESGADH